MIKSIFLNFSLYLISVALLMASTNLYLKTCISFILGIIVTRLFILGHDLAHQFYFKNRLLNDSLAQICLLPSLTPLSLWRMGHNLVHHRYTNLKTHDFIWAPLSLNEYTNLSISGKIQYKIYRSFPGLVLYTFFEVWLKRFWFPIKELSLEKRRKDFLKDLFKVYFFIFFFIAISRLDWINLFFSLIVPFLIFIFFFGLATFLHHTHPNIQWYDCKEEWAQKPAYTNTAHWKIPQYINKLSYFIMEHIAHHKSTSVKAIDLLEQEQSLLKKENSLILEDFSWKKVFELMKKCKIYDYNNKKWLSFKEADAILEKNFSLFKLF